MRPNPNKCYGTSFRNQFFVEQPDYFFHFFHLYFACPFGHYKHSEFILTFGLLTTHIVERIRHYIRAPSNLLKCYSRCDPSQYICRLFGDLAQFPFATSEMELDYHHQKLNVRIGSRVHARIKAKYLRTFLKILKKGAMYILVSNLSIKVLLYSVFCQDVF